MRGHRTTFATLAGGFLLMAGMGCGGDNPVSTGGFSSLDAAVESIAALEANNLDAELLALSEDIELATITEDPIARPRPGIDRLREALGLSEDQVAQIETIIEASRQSLQDIRDQVRAGTLTREEARTQIEAIREDKRTQIEAVLTPEQLALWEELRAHHGRQFNRRPLIRFLELTADQVAQIEAIMQATWDQIQALRDQVEAGGITPEEARAQLQAIREAERDQIIALLDEDQLARFTRLLNHPRHGFGPRGFGRGPRGDIPRPLAS